ncbi:MAG: hypothetical protein WCC38_05880 [Pseudonocardiaceae bacterium]
MAEILGNDHVIASVVKFLEVTGQWRVQVIALTSASGMNAGANPSSLNLG